jgi:hypothetical protein
MLLLPSTPWWMYMPLRGLCTSRIEPSAAVRTVLPLRVASVLPAGPG